MNSWHRLWLIILENAIRLMKLLNLKFNSVKNLSYSVFTVQCKSTSRDIVTWSADHLHLPLTLYTVCYFSTSTGQFSRLKSDFLWTISARAHRIGSSEIMHDVLDIRCNAVADSERHFHVYFARYRHWTRVHPLCHDVYKFTKLWFASTNTSAVVTLIIVLWQMKHVASDISECWLIERFSW